MQAAAACIICDYRNATFRTVPKRLVNFHVLICGAIVLPFSNPVFQHLSSFSIRYRYLFDCIDFKSRSV